MKKLAFKAVLVATVILGGVLGYSIWKSTSLTSQGYFESGKKYFDAKKYSEASIQFRNAVQKDPSARDARYFLALSYLNQQDLASAVTQLKSLLEYHPDDVPANLQLGGIYLTGGRGNPDLFHQAQEIAAKVLAKEPQNVGALILSGNASAGLQDYHSSVDLYEKAVNLDPQNTAAFVSLGTSEVLQKNYAEAEQAFLKARQVDPKDKSAIISLGNYYRAVHDSAKAEAVFKEALSLYPADRDIYLQAVEFYNQAGRFDDVQKVLNDAQAKNSQDPAPSLILVEFYLAKDRPADARKLLLELKDKFPKNLDVAAKLALNLLPDQPDKARTEIDQIVKGEPKNPVGYVLLGELQFLSGKYDDAAATLGKNPALDSPFPQPHFFLGNIAMKKGQVDEAMVHYQKSLAVNAKYLPARVALAELFMNKGQLADARQEIGKALDVRPDFVPARMLKAELDSRDKNYPVAEQELTGLLKDQPDNAALYRQMGIYDDQRGRTADAEKNLVHALDLQPASQQSLRDLTNFYIQTKQTDKALARINAVPDDKKTAFHYELLGLVYSRSGKSDDAEKAYKKALALDPARTSSDVYLFADYMKNGRVDEGLQKLDELIKKNPNNASAYGVKGQIYESQGKLDEAKQNYTQALKLDPNSELAANNLAFLIADKGGDLNTALGYAQMSRKKQPDNPSIADTLGWVYYKMGNYVLAREQTGFAVSKQPENGVFEYHMGMIYKETKQIHEAQAAFKKAASSPKDFKEKSLAQAALKDISK